MTDLETVNEGLRELSGRPARFLRFTASHDRATIEITAAEGSRSHLIIIGCSRLASPTFWTLDRPEVIETGSGVMEFRDGSEVRIEFELEVQLAAAPGLRDEP